MSYPYGSYNYPPQGGAPPPNPYGSTNYTTPANPAAPYGTTNYTQPGAGYPQVHLVMILMHPMPNQAMAAKPMEFHLLEEIHMVLQTMEHLHQDLVMEHHMLIHHLMGLILQHHQQ